MQIKKTDRHRLDNELVARGLLKTRAQALLSIKEKNVLLNGNICQKPNKEIKETDILSLVQEPKYVSRGGDKLEAAFKNFKSYLIKGSRVLDIGSSTGGFTDFLLQNGADRVYAVDVGTGQFDDNLKSDPRVVLMEKTDIRKLKSLPERVDLVVIDVSFISLTYIIPCLGHFVKTKSEVVALVKPQFEVGRGYVNRQGLVTDKGLYKNVLEKIQECFKQNGFDVEGNMQSPVIGGSGNIEFLIKAVRK